MKFFKSFLFRYTRFFLVLLVIFMAAEIGVLVYVNNFFLTDRGTYKAEKINASSKSAMIYKKQNVPTDGTGFTGSHDGRYVAYQENGNVTVLDMTTGQIYHVGAAEGLQVDHFKWVYDRDRLILAEKSQSDEYVKLYYWDSKDKTLTEIRENSNNKDLEVDLGSSSDNVGAIDLSTETVKTYLKITSSSGKSRMWIVDAFDGIASRSNTVTRNIGAIQCFKNSDTLLYENKDNGKVYLYGRSKAVSIDGHTSLKLVGFDEEDNVYMAAMSGDTTDTVYRCSYDTDQAEWSWTEIPLGRSVSSSSIYVAYGGTVYVKSSGRLVRAEDLSSSGSTSSGSESGLGSSSASDSKSSGSSSPSAEGVPYQGKIISLYSGGFQTLYAGQILPYTFD